MADASQLGKGPTGERSRPGGGSQAGPLGLRLASWQQWVAEGEQVPELRYPENLPIYERMLFTDSQVLSLYLGTTLPVLDFVYWVHPNPANASSPELVAYEQALADDLGLPYGEPTPEEEELDLPRSGGLYRFDFRQHVAELLLALGLSHYVFEQVGVIGDDGLWHLRKLLPLHPATIEEFDVAEDGGLRGVRQKGAVVGTSGPAGLSMGRAPLIPVDRLVVYAWQADARTRWTGRSMLRSLYRHWVVKDRLIRVDAINHERAGGVPGIETDHTFQGMSLHELAEVAQGFRVGEDGGYALPPGATLKLNRLGGTDVIASLNYHDDAMARVWSAQVRQLAQGGDSANRAVGSVFESLEDKARRAVVRWMLGIFREHVVEDWWAWNVPPVDGRVPPHPVVAGRPRRGVAPPGSGPSGGEAGGDPPPVAARFRPRRDHAGAAGRRGSAPRAAAQLTLPARPLRREPSEAELRAAVDFAAMDLAYESGAVDAEQWLDAVLSDAVAALSDAIVLTKKGEVRQRVTRADMARVRVPVLGAEELAELLLPAARAGAAMAAQEALAQGHAVAVPSDEALAGLVRDHAQAVAQQVADGLSLAGSRKAVQLAQGRTAPEVASGVVEHMNSLKHQWERAQLHGAVQMAMNAGRFEVMAQVPDEVPMEFEASEILDASTCGPCAEDDGRRFATLAEAMAHYPTGGNHRCEGGPYCRGTVVALYDEL